MKLNKIWSIKKSLKYKNERVSVNNLKFDSKKEMKRYFELKELEKAGVIENLELKPARIEIIAKTEKHKAKHYQADFSYTQKGVRVLEDCKSEYLKKTELWRMKEMLILNYCQKHGLEFRLS